MAATLLRRAGGMVITILGATLVIFFILHMTGDPTTLMLPESATP